MNLVVHYIFSILFPTASLPSPLFCHFCAVLDLLVFAFLIISSLELVLLRCLMCLKRSCRHETWMHWSTLQWLLAPGCLSYFISYPLSLSSHNWPSFTFPHMHQTCSYLRAFAFTVPSLKNLLWHSVPHITQEFFPENSSSTVLCLFSF